MTIPSQNEPKKQEPKASNDFDHVLDYCKTHSKDIIAYVLMVLGILLLFFDPIYGGLLVGIVTGIYFSKEIWGAVLKWKHEISAQLTASNLIFAGAVIAFFISAPAIFLGAAIAIGIKQLFIESKK